MPPTTARDLLEGPPGILLGLLLLVGAGYALLTANIFLYIALVSSLLVTLYVLFLFVRLVVAVEHIAYKQ